MKLLEKRKSYVVLRNISVSSGHSNQKDKIVKSEEASDTAIDVQQQMECEK